MSKREWKRKKWLVCLLLVLAFFSFGCATTPQTGTPSSATPAEQQKPSTPVSSPSPQGEVLGEKALTAKQAVALAEVEAKKALGDGADVVTIHGEQEGTSVDGKATNWDILFANPEGKTLYVTIENGQITQTRSTHSDAILQDASGGKWIDSVEAAQVAQANGGSSFQHKVVNPSVNYFLGELAEIAWFGDKKAGVIDEQDLRPAWRVTYDNQVHFYVDALSGEFIAKGSYENKP